MTSKIQKDRDGFPKPDYEKMIGSLQEIANSHYRESVQSGIHAFIEHTGIMNEHLKLLRDAARAGLQVEHVNVHGSERFPMAAHQAAYIGEKFACIFAPYFTKETFEVFAEEIRKEVK